MQHLEIETPEHVVLDLEIAGVGSRGLAALIDLGVLGGATVGVFVLLGILFGVGLTRVQTIEVARLATDWSGQGPIDLPGCTASRTGGRIVFAARS